MSLPPGTEVIVKVQYPEVAEHYEADFDNLEVLAAWLFPDRVSVVRNTTARATWGDQHNRTCQASLHRCIVVDLRLTRVLAVCPRHPPQPPT